MVDNPDEVILRQARYVLAGLHVKDPDCGYRKMADACERAADRLMAERHATEDAQ